MTKERKEPFGRPSIYTPELANLICERVATHDCGIQRLCDMYDDMPAKATLRTWKLKHTDFAIQYAKARQTQVENYAEDIIDISDDGRNDYLKTDEGISLNHEHINRSRLRIDTRKWMASKLAPKIYGDAKRVEELETENARYKAEIAAIRDKLDKTNVSDY